MIRLQQLASKSATFVLAQERARHYHDRVVVINFKNRPIMEFDSEGRFSEVAASQLKLPLEQLAGRI